MSSAATCGGLANEPRVQMPYRIGLVSEACGGGIGKHVLDIAEGMATAGHDLLLVYSENRVDHGFKERLDRRAEFGYTAVPIAMRRSPGIRDIRAIEELRRAVRQFGQLDILHGHSSKGGALARLAHWGLARAVVYTPNAWYTMNPELTPFARVVFGGVERALATMTECIIVTSAEERAHACDLGIDPKKMVEIANGVELWDWTDVMNTRCRVRRQYGIADDAVVVGFLGRFVRQKAPDKAVRVIAQLLSLHDDITPIMAGNGDEAERTRAMAKELGVENRIIWLAEVRGRDIIPAFDIFLMTSLYEGFPYALIEALNCGCAAVTTSVGGASACVRNGVNGFVVDGDETSLLVAALERTLEILRNRAQVRHVSRSIAEEFSRERMVKRTLDLYDAVAGETARVRP